MQPTRIALVTGANRGIGWEIARQLGAAGFKVWIGARDHEKGAAAAGKLTGEGHQARSVVIDLTNPQSATSAADMIAAEDDKLDVLINNAGVSAADDRGPADVDIDSVRSVFETNFFGTLAVTQAFLPLLRKSREKAQIINISSSLGSLANNGDPDWVFADVNILGYCGSKAALNLMTVLLAKQLKPEGIAVNAVEPGFTATELNAYAGTQTLEEGAEAAVRLATEGAGSTGSFVSRHGIEPW